MKKIRYTEKEEKFIYQSLIEGKSLEEIAKEMGREYNAVQQRAYMMRRGNYPDIKLPKRLRRQVKILVVETGEVFDTIVETSKAFKCSPSVIQDRLKFGSVFSSEKPYHFKKIGGIPAKDYKKQNKGK